MPRLSIWFIRSALIYLALGFTFGALLLANKGFPIIPEIWRLLPAHIELLLVGWTLQLAMGFDKAELAIRLGYEAAAAMGPQLAALAAPQAPHPAERPRLRLPRIDEIRVDSNAPVSTALLRNMIKQPLGEKLDSEQMERDIAEIYGLDEFSRVDYDVAREDERYVLTLRATAHPAGVNYLRLGMSWDQDSRGSSEFGLRASWLQKGINSLGAEWYTVGQLGGRSRFGTEFHQPLDVGRRYFVDARYDYQQRLINISERGDVRARALVDDHRLELAPGMHFANLASLRAGRALARGVVVIGVLVRC